MSEVAEDTILNQLTLFAADSLANLTVWPGSEEARRMTVISGLNFYALLENSDPLGFLRRMFRASYYCISTLCYLTWKVKATPAGHLIFQLALSMPRILESESLSLPTPTTVDAGSYFNQSKSPGAKKRPTLGAMAKHGLWPTPKASEPGMSAKTSGRPVEKSTHLTTQVALAEGLINPATGRMWPTPTVHGNYNRKGASKNSGDGLATAVKMYPTPTARDHKGEGFKGQLGTEIAGQLNAEFVEWLMGFPRGWTDLTEDTGMQNGPEPRG